MQTTKGPEYLYQLFDVLPKQIVCEINALQAYNITFKYISLLDFMMKMKLKIK